MKCPDLAAAFATLILIVIPTSALGGKVDVRALAFQPGTAMDEVFAHDPAAPPEAAPIELEIKSYLNHEFSELTLLGRRVLITTGRERDSEVLGEVTIPKGARSVILVFLPGSGKDGKRFSIMPIEDSASAFPAGSFHVSNLCDVPIRFMLEKKGYEIPSGEIELITDPPVRTGNQTGMSAYAKLDGNWKRVASGMWPHPGENRVIQIVFRESSSGLVHLRAFDDVPPRKTTVAAAP